MGDQPNVNKSQRSTVLNTFTRHTPGAPQTPVPRLVHPTPCPPLCPPPRAAELYSAASFSTLSAASSSAAMIAVMS